MELVTVENFLYIPAAIVGGLFFVSISLFFQKRYQESHKDSLIAMQKIFLVFILGWALLSIPLVYNYIVFLKIAAPGMEIASQDVYTYLWLSMLGIVLQSILYNRFMGKFAVVETKERFWKLMTFMILGFSLFSSINMFALFFILNKIQG